jgi:hypothetical protein
MALIFWDWLPVLSAWHGMAWHGMAWHGMVNVNSSSTCICVKTCYDNGRREYEYEYEYEYQRCDTYYVKQWWSITAGLDTHSHHVYKY